MIFSTILQNVENILFGGTNMYTMPIIIPTDSIADLDDLADIQRIIKVNLEPKGFTLKHAPLPHVYQYQGENLVSLLCFEEPQLFILEQSISNINDAFSKEEDLPFAISVPLCIKNGIMKVNPRSSMLLVNAS